MPPCLSSSLAPGSEEGDAAQRLVDAAVERLSETAFGRNRHRCQGELAGNPLVLYARVLGAQTPTAAGRRSEGMRISRSTSARMGPPTTRHG